MSMARGIVEFSNEHRGTFCVRLDDGTYAYFRVSRDVVPAVDDRLEWPGGLETRPRAVTNATRANRALPVLSAILGLPREVALGLAS